MTHSCLDHSAEDRNRTCVCLVQSQVQRPAVAASVFQLSRSTPSGNRTRSAGFKGPRRVYAPERIELKEQAPAAGIEPATKRLTVALPYQHRTHRNVKWRETDSNHRPPGYEPGELPTAPSRKAPSGSRTHTSAMARQQATATSWAQNCITTKLSKIEAVGRL